jgi:hypothetical protein
MVVVWLTEYRFYPLKTNADATTFSFILNSGSTNPALVNEDILKFNYARRTFVSRACGFKTEYTLDPNSVCPTDAAVGDQKVQYIAVKTSTIITKMKTSWNIF